MKNGIVVFSVIFAAFMLFLQHFPKNGVLLFLFSCVFLILLAVLTVKREYGILAVVLFACVLSISWQLIYRDFTKTPGWILGDSVQLSATVTDYSYLNGKGTGVAVRAVADTVNGIVPERRPRLLLYIDDRSASFAPGGKIELTAVLEEPENTSEFPAFTYYKTRYIDIIGFSAGEYIYSPPEKTLLRYLPAVAAHTFKSRIDLLFDEPRAGFMRALITGDKRDLRYGFYEDIRICGLSHTIAVSGMHIAFLSAFIIFLVGRRRAPFIALPVMVFFALMVGATSSVLRAVIMQTAFFAAVLLKREKDGLNALMLALVLILFINPYSVSDIGLRLSFFATLGLVLFSGIKDAMIRSVRIKNRVVFRAVSATASVIGATLCATVFTIPVLMTSFQTVSLISPISNVLAVFLVNAVFILGICAVPLSFLWFRLGSALAAVADFACGVFEFIVTRLAEIPFASVYTGNAYIVALAVYLYCLLFIFVIDIKRSVRARVYLCCSLAVILAAAAFCFTDYSQGGLEVTVLDVGQGQCVAAEYNGCRVFIDCGGNLSRNAGDIAYRYLVEKNTRSADALILTHLHDDHINGCERLLGKAKIKRVFIAEDKRNTAECDKIVKAADESGTQIVYVSDDKRLMFDDLTVDLYLFVDEENENENGIVALLRLDDFEVLVTGDIGKQTEKVLVEEKELPDIEAYIAGHHGSKDSSSISLLNTVLPELCVISVGKNHYGHPGEDTLFRLGLLNTVVKRTDMHGNVIFNSKSFSTGVRAYAGD